MKNAQMIIIKSIRKKSGEKNVPQISVMRFSNIEIEKQFENVCRIIDETIRLNMKNLQLPPPPAGGTPLC